MLDDLQLRLELLALLREGKKIEAIKLLRTRTGAQLKDAKEQVEQLAAENGIVTKSGCMGMLLVSTLWLMLAFVWLALG
jgi:hypothetical protein